VIPRAEFTTPEVEITATAPTPLFSTQDDYVTASRRLIASKALDIDDHGDEP
jgi:hypothetical protein